MFSKIDKKILIWLVVAAVALVITGVFVYGQLAGTALEAQNSEGGANTENISQEEMEKSTPDIDIGIEGIETEGDDSGGFTVCLDECGDGICQSEDLECPDGSLNCVCFETVEECPQDCKN